MTSCSFVTGKDRQGKDVACGLVAQDASAYCPRHTFLRNIELQAESEKEEKRVAAKRAAMGPASDREEMLRRGFQFRGTRECTGCGQHIEWWLTPNGHRAPYNPMPEPHVPLDLALRHLQPRHQLPEGLVITVSLCCNDPDNGNSLGKVCAVHIHGEPDIELEGPQFPNYSNTLRTIDKPKDAPDRCDRGFRIGRHVFGCYGWKSWYGNWCWDGTRMKGVDVLRLLKVLRELGYRCVASEADFGEAYDKGQELTPALVQNALA